jgi:Flp pilus assembly pilin Flp
MKRLCVRIWREEQGVLTFEWVLILTLLIIGIIGGLAGIRDALSIELSNVAGAAAAVDMSYSVGVSQHGLGTTFQYQQPQTQVTVVRQDGTTPQPPVFNTGP